MKKLNILDLLHPNRTTSKTVQNAEQVAAIPHTTDAVGWRPVSYSTPDSFDSFMSSFEQKAQAFIDSAHPDIYNGRYMDGTIESETEKARDLLADIHTEHRRIIHGIRIYQEASLIHLNQLIAEGEEELRKIEEELAK